MALGVEPPPRLKRSKILISTSPGEMDIKMQECIADNMKSFLGMEYKDGKFMVLMAEVDE